VAFLSRDRGLGEALAQAWKHINPNLLLAKVIIVCLAFACYQGEKRCVSTIAGDLRMPWAYRDLPRHVAKILRARRRNSGVCFLQQVSQIDKVLSLGPAFTIATGTT